MSGSVPRRSVQRLGVAIALALCAANVLTITGSAAVAAEVPYTDPGAKGDLTLCDATYNPLQEGRTTDRPFVWRAVGSEPAPERYDVEGRLATLFAFQPIKGVAPGEWVGEQINGPAKYTNPDRPMAQFTEIDYAIEVFIDRFPLTWDGYLQLRLMYGAPGQGTSVDYAAMDLQVKDGGWRILRGGSTACGTPDEAVSFETALPDFAERVEATRQEEAAKAATRPPTLPQSGAPIEPTAPGNPAASPAPTGTASNSSTDAEASAEPEAGNGGSSTDTGGSAVPALVVAAFAAGAGGAVLARRRKR